MNPPRPYVNYESFYKVIRNNSGDARKLRIPLAFWNYSKQALQPGSVFLKSQLKGLVWRVQLVEQNDGVYLRDGWAKFFEDNKFREGDLLLFTPLQGPVIHVKICMQGKITTLNPTPYLSEKHKGILVPLAKRSMRDEQPKEGRYISPIARVSKIKKLEEILKPSSKRSMRREYPEEGKFGIPGQGGITIMEPMERLYVDDNSDSDEYVNRYVDDDSDSEEYVSRYEVGESSKRRKNKGKAINYEDAGKKYYGSRR